MFLFWIWNCIRFTFTFLTLHICFDKNFNIVGVDNSSLIHDDDQKKDILILVEELKQGLKDTTITAY